MDSSVMRGAIERFRRADGTSHTRALAYQSAFVMMSGFIGLVGLASVLGWRELRATVQELATSLAPGPSARLLQEAAQQGSSGGTTAAVVGLGAAMVSGTLAMAQLCRSADRLHGVDENPPAVSRYGRAVVLALTGGLLLVLGGLVLGGGRSIATGAGLQGGAATAWEIARWPLGIALAGIAIMLLFRMAAPGRPTRRDVLVGTGVSLVLWALFTVMLGLYLSFSSTSQSTYGPLLSVIALLLWALATSAALHLGLATMAQRRGAGAAHASSTRTITLQDSPSLGRTTSGRDGSS